MNGIFQQKWYRVYQTQFTNSSNSYSSKCKCYMEKQPQFGEKIVEKFRKGAGIKFFNEKRVTFTFWYAVQQSLPSAKNQFQMHFYRFHQNLNLQINNTMRCLQIYPFTNSVISITCTGKTVFIRRHLQYLKHSTKNIPIRNFLFFKPVMKFAISH